ncbi:hypothetical protein [Streptomyces sp. NPDC057257]|uniref:hypothetical protein n=1 Tax=Streptomyces sp. NPDC057257 TaxID=3346071 RepID=UPI00362CB711
MPRGRHRHSPPLHRLLPPSAIAGVSLVCAFGPWVFTESAVLRVIAAFAAATAVVGAAVMRRWDAQAGKQVADLTRARASDEWRHEERVAELETDLEESRELRAKLEQRLRAKRSELAGLRNEHAALLRRYATAETERASALEGRRLLEIEAGAPTTPALPPVAADETESAEAEAVAASADETEAVADLAEEAEAPEADEEPEAPAVFSPEGSKLFLRAGAALKKLDKDGDASPKAADAVAGEDEARADFEDDGDFEADAEVEGDVEAGGDVEAEADDEDAAASGESASEDGASPEDDGSPKGGGSPKGDGRSKRDGAPKGAPVTAHNGAAASQAPAPAEGTAPAAQTAPAVAEAAASGGTEAAAQEDEAQGQPEAVDGHERAAATTPARSAQPVQQPSGHFVAPTAVAVVPGTPARRPAIQGGFDFFGNKKEPNPAALDAVQNEDLADVVGQEALAVHKAEAEAEFKPADEEARGVGQVIDLTAHDETEQIDLQGLRSAVS